MDIIAWVLYQYFVSVIIGSIVIEFIGIALARTIILRVHVLGFTIHLTIGAVIGFIIRQFLGI